MKKIILSVAAVFAFGFASAQEKEEVKGGTGFAKGNMFISGAVGINTTNDKNLDKKTTGFEIEPKFAYFVSNNIAIGAKVGYASDKTKTAGTTTSDMSTFSVGAFGRYYTTPANQFSLFGQLGFDYMSTKNNMAGGNTLNGFELAFKPGLSYFVSNNFAIEATIGKLGYGSEKSNATGAKESNEFNLGLDLRSIGFGVIYKF